MSEDEDRRTWVQRGFKGKKTGPTTPKDRLIWAALLAVLGAALLASAEGEGLGLALGVLALVGAGYHLLVAAIANGTNAGS